MRLTLAHLDSFTRDDDVVGTSPGLPRNGETGLEGAESLSEPSTRSTTGAKLRKTVYMASLQ